MVFNKNSYSDLSINSKLNGSLMGFITADALGVPVEFMNRASLKISKIVDMEEYGTHNQPKGTWSDDSSMVIATIDGLMKSKEEIDYQLIMNNFLNWMQNADYTPFNEVFDIGNSTRAALYIYQTNINNSHPEEFICGSEDISSNGNGSLMRILPVSIYLYLKNIDYRSNEYFEIIKKVSSMTHSHIYSVLGCYIYSIFVFELLSGNDKFKSYKNLQLYLSDLSIDGIEIYERIIKKDIFKLSEKEIRSSGYVVDTLEAAIWCLLTTNNYKEAVLKAVNLGDDTDTVGAVTGGLAGLVYGYDSIPVEWIDSLQKKDYLVDLISSFINKFLDKSEKENSVRNKFDLQILEETIEDLKNNSESCTLVGGETKDGVFIIPESMPGIQLSNFIKYLYENDMIDKNYLEKHKLCENKTFEDLTLDETLTRLAFIIRGDRFCSGLLNSYVKDGTFLKLVEMIKKNINN